MILYWEKNIDYRLRCRDGFSLIELMIVVGIVGLIMIGGLSSYNSSRSTHSVHDELQSINRFLKRIRLDSFTQKVQVDVVVNANDIVATFNYPVPVGPVQRRIQFQNGVVATGSPFSVSSRGNFSNGNIRLNNPTGYTKYGCVNITGIMLRLGDINGGGCDPK